MENNKKNKFNLKNLKKNTCNSLFEIEYFLNNFNSFLQSLHFVQNNGQNAISRHTSIFLLLRNSVHRKYIFK